MLHTLSKVDAELAVSGVMHADHRALSLTSIAHPAGDARRVAEACQSLPAGLVDRPPTVDSQRFVLPLSRPAGGDPAGAGEKLANDHRGRVDRRFGSAHRSRTATRTSRLPACWTLSFLAARFCLMVLLGFLTVAPRGDLSAMALPVRPGV